MTAAEMASEERDRHVVVRVTGEVDLANAEVLGADVRRAVENTTFALALDLTGTTYVDSAGVRLLFDLAAELRSRRQELVVVVQPRSALARILGIVAFDRVAVVADDLEAALASVDIRPREADPGV